VAISEVLTFRDVNAGQIRVWRRTQKPEVEGEQDVRIDMLLGEGALMLRITGDSKQQVRLARTRLQAQLGQGEPAPLAAFERTQKRHHEEWFRGEAVERLRRLASEKSVPKRRVGSDALVPVQAEPLRQLSGVAAPPLPAPAGVAAGRATRSVLPSSAARGNCCRG
jgi:hypothetical protein